MRASQRTILVLVLVALAGCVTRTRTSRSTPGVRGAITQQRPSPTGTAPISNTDACAGQLHDISGMFLLYYANHHQLPPRIDDLSEVQTIFSSEFICPVSGKGYIYNPMGIAAPGGNGRAILYDATPAHAGFRWAIAIIEPPADSNRALIAKVIAMPESAFAPAPVR